MAARLHRFGPVLLAMRDDLADSATRSVRIGGIGDGGICQPLLCVSCARSAGTWRNCPIVRRRRIDLPVCLALAAGPITLVALLPLVQQTRASMATWFGSSDWNAAAESYLFLLKFVRWPLLGAFAAAGLALAARNQSRDTDKSTNRLPLHELAAVLGFVALPLLGVVMSRVTGTTFTVRYAAPAIIGFAMLLAYLANGHRLLAKYGAILLVLILVGRIAQAMRSDFRRAVEDAAMSREFQVLEGLGRSDLPVVIADPFTFLKLFHYAPDSLDSHDAFEFAAKPLRRLARNGR